LRHAAKREREKKEKRGKGGDDLAEGETPKEKTDNIKKGGERKEGQKRDICRRRQEREKR